MGVFHPDLVGIQIRVLQRLGAQHTLVVHGQDGLDGISLGATTLVAELKDGGARYTCTPRTSASPRPATASCVDGPEQSRQMLLGVLDGQSGLARDIVLLNAGATLYAANVADSLVEGIPRGRARALGTAAPPAPNWMPSSATTRPWTPESATWTTSSKSSSRSARRNPPQGLAPATSLHEEAEGRRGEQRGFEQPPAPAGSPPAMPASMPRSRSVSPSKWRPWRRTSARRGSPKGYARHGVACPSVLTDERARVRRSPICKPRAACGGCRCCARDSWWTNVTR